MTLIDELGAAVGEAFAACGLDARYGRVTVADRPDLAQFQCNGALAAAKSAAKSAKENPREIAKAVCDRLFGNPIFAALNVAGPGFINIDLSDAFIAARASALAEDARLGAWRKRNTEKIIMDYGGPNIAKPLHVGHLRSAIIGESLKRIFRFCGDDVVSDVHFGDWGLPMGQLITELKREKPDLVYFDDDCQGVFPATSPISLEDLERLYPEASAACKNDPARAEEARLATAALQQGREGYMALWRHFVAISRAAVESEYADLGVTFELWRGESDADPLIEPLADELRAKGLLAKSDGAEVIRVAKDDDKKKIPPLIFFKTDGAVTYGATDLATILDRVRTERPGRMLYVVDQRQALHFEQVFRASGLAGVFPEDKLEHIGFGTMNGEDGKPFKTREGGVLKLRDLIDMVTARARKRLDESGLAQGYGAEETSAIAKKVGVAALKFADLSNPRVSDYIFDLDRFIAFEGKTGPYLLYASVRVRSVLAKAEEKGAGSPGRVAIECKEERELALRLLAFADALRETYDKRMPHILCEHVFQLAQSFSKLYGARRIADEAAPRKRASRLALAGAAGRQIDLILDLLGVETPQRM